MLVFALLIHFGVLAYASVVFQDCGSAYDLEDVDITGCNMKMPCYITLGDKVPVSVHFVADFSSLQLDQDVIININYLNLETEVTPDPCEFDVCPVPTDCITSFTSVMSVPRNMALNQRGWLKWRVYNEKKQLVLCYSVLVQTQSPLQKFLRQVAEFLGFDNDNGFEPPRTLNGTDSILQKIAHAQSVGGDLGNNSITKIPVVPEVPKTDSHTGKQALYLLIKPITTEKEGRLCYLPSSTQSFLAAE